MANFVSDYPSCREKCPARTLYTDKNVTKHGCIRKKAGGFKIPGTSTYDQRYVIIYKGWVYYYKDKDSDKPQNFFSLQGFNPWVIQAEEEEKAKHPFVFKVFSSKQTDRTWYFATEYQDEMETWVEAFKSEIQRYNPISPNLKKNCVSVPTSKPETLTVVQPRSSSCKDHTHEMLHIDLLHNRHSAIEFTLRLPDAYKGEDDDGNYEPVGVTRDNSRAISTNFTHPPHATLPTKPTESKRKPLPPLPSSASLPRSPLSPRLITPVFVDMNKTRVISPNLPQMPTIPISNREPSIALRHTGQQREFTYPETDSSFDSGSTGSYESVKESAPEYLTPLPVDLPPKPVTKTKSLPLVPHTQKPEEEIRNIPPVPPREPINQLPMCDVDGEYEKPLYEETVSHRTVLSSLPRSTLGHLPPTPEDHNERVGLNNRVHFTPPTSNFPFENTAQYPHKPNEIKTAANTRQQFRPPVTLSKKPNEIRSPTHVPSPITHPTNGLNLKSPTYFQPSNCVSPSGSKRNEITSPTKSISPQQFQLPNISHNLKPTNIGRDTPSANRAIEPAWQKPKLKPVNEISTVQNSNNFQQNLKENVKNGRNTPTKWPKPATLSSPSPTQQSSKPPTPLKPKPGPPTLPKPKNNQTKSSDKQLSQPPPSQSNGNSKGGGGLASKIKMFENS